MKSFSAPVLAALTSSQLALATLVKIDFPSGSVCLNSSSWDITYNGDTYRGAFGLGQISPIDDKGGELPGIQLEIGRVDPAYLTLALDEADEVQGAEVTISTAIFDAETLAVLHVETDWTGYGDTMGISEDGETASISMTAESKGVDLLRGNPLTYSDGDQQSLVPGDRIFEYNAEQSDKPVVWPAREYFQR